MKLHEFIKTTLIENHGLFSTQAFRDGLVRYRQKYEKNKKDVAQWKINREGQPDDWVKKNPLPAPLLIDGGYTDREDLIAISAGLLAVLHDDTLRSSVPIIPSDWPDNVREFLKNNVLPRFRRKELEDTSSGWGLEFSNLVIQAITTLKEIQNPTGTESKFKLDDPNAVWSKPMSKTRMMNALGIDSQDTFNSYAERIGIEKVNHKVYLLRLDTMNPRDREKLEKV